MNTTFWTWLGVAGALGLALFFILGGGAAEPVASPVTAAVTTAAASNDGRAYWEPVTAAPAVSYSMPPTVSTGCAPCTIAQVVAPAPVSPIRTAPALVAGCGTPVETACAPMSCRIPARTCESSTVTACCTNAPGINRNQLFCVDECSFIQLHSTVAHPIATCYRFQWTASRGSFLDPTSSDPIYYSPSTGFPGGEDVWIVLTVIEPSGARYTDQVKLHVRDVR